MTAPQKHFALLSLAAKRAELDAIEGTVKAIGMNQYAIRQAVFDEYAAKNAVPTAWYSLPPSLRHHNTKHDFAEVSDTGSIELWQYGRMGGENEAYHEFELDIPGDEEIAANYKAFIESELASYATSMREARLQEARDEVANATARLARLEGAK